MKNIFLLAILALLALVCNANVSEENLQQISVAYGDLKINHPEIKDLESGDEQTRMVLVGYHGTSMEAAKGIMMNGYTAKKAAYGTRIYTTPILSYAQDFVQSHDPALCRVFMTLESVLQLDVFFYDARCKNEIDNPAYAVLVIRRYGESYIEQVDFLPNLESEMVFVCSPAFETEELYSLFDFTNFASDETFTIGFYDESKEAAAHVSVTLVKDRLKNAADLTVRDMPIIETMKQACQDHFVNRRHDTAKAVYGFHRWNLFGETHLKLMCLIPPFKRFFDRKNFISFEEVVDRLNTKRRFIFW